MGKRRRAMQSNKNKNFNRGKNYAPRDYELPVKDNALFKLYYQGQGIVPEEEWDAMYDTLKDTLPVTFRITGYKSQAQELLKNIKGTFFKDLIKETVDGAPVPPPRTLPWYPNDLAWRVELSRKNVRSSECFSRLHEFLIQETECGAISRQEAVSMIPPLVMDIKSHHKILDMCAAPGSKTAQLIEYLHSNCTGGELPTGFVIANDNDNKRCYLMVHQVKRLQSPCCIIVNHDATIFPKMKTIVDDTEVPQHIMYDRILCDVPCSGDGTMRKNVDVWSKWNPLQGANMHGLQSKILKRGCQLLALGGRLVYSTCSLNPAENEAVVAEMLRSSKGAMELIDISDQLPGLKYRNGISNWRVMSKTGEWLGGEDEIPPSLKTQYKHTIFPPTQEEAEALHLDRCIRVLPHQQDTGGFFIAALQKVRHLPGSHEARLEAERTKSAEEAISKDTTNDAPAEETDVTEGKKRDAPVGQEPPKKKQKIWGYKEDPFLFMEETDPIWPSIRDFFGLSSDFPFNQIMFRSEQGKRTLYFVSKSIRNIVQCNDNIRFINMGVKAFTRSPSPMVPDCDFRMSQECLSILLPLMTKRRVNVGKQDAVIIINEENPFTNGLSKGTQDQLKSLAAGSTVFVFEPTEQDPSPNCQIVFCGWRGKYSVRCFGARADRSHFLMLLGEDLLELNKKVAEKKAAREQQKKDEETLKHKEAMDDLPPLDNGNNTDEKVKAEDVEDKKERTDIDDNVKNMDDSTEENRTIDDGTDEKKCI